MRQLTLRLPLGAARQRRGSVAVRAEAQAETSPLAAARIRRRLTVEQAAARAKLDVEDVRALEQNRLWRFASVSDAVATALVYAAALGITGREARRLAGLPAGRRLAEVWSLRRWLAALAFTGACGALVWFVIADFRSEEQPVAAPPPPTAADAPAAPALPERWEIRVDVFNGTGKGNAAAGVANEVAGLAYRVGKVGNAKRRDYVDTRVYYPPEAQAIALRLAAELGIKTAALPGGDDPRRLVVIVGRDL